jgi:hypothetical protein
VVNDRALELHFSLLWLFRSASLSAHKLAASPSRREEQFQRREQIIKKKDLELQENLIRFNKFLQVPPPPL